MPTPLRDFHANSEYERQGEVGGFKQRKRLRPIVRTDYPDWKIDAIIEDLRR